MTGAPTAVPAATRAGARPGLVPAGETVLLMIKPDPTFIVLRTLGVFAAIAAATLAAWWVLGLLGAPVPGLRLVGLGLLLAAGQLVWNALEWWARVYVLTDRRVMRLGGVLRRLITEVPLDRVQSVLVYKSIRERLFGLGSVGIASAGTGAVEVWWVMVASPAEVTARVRRAVESARRGGGDAV